MNVCFQGMLALSIQKGNVDYWEALKSTSLPFSTQLHYSDLKNVDWPLTEEMSGSDALQMLWLEY